jgi:hypothetical protein
MRLPELWAKCEACDPECAGHPPEDVSWTSESQKWLCIECSVVEGICRIEDGKYVHPTTYASDAMPNKEEQMERLIAAATKQRLGVK